MLFGRREHGLQISERDQVICGKGLFCLAVLESCSVSEVSNITFYLRFAHDSETFGELLCLITLQPFVHSNNFKL